MKNRSVARASIKVCTIGAPFGSHKLRQLLQARIQVALFHAEHPNSGEWLGDGTRVIFILESAAAASSVSHRLRILRARFPKARFLAIGRQTSADELCRLIYQGVDGFLEYEEIDRQLWTALRSLAEGHLWIPPEVFAQYVAYSRQLRTESGNNLTERELEVLGLVARGFSNKEVSSQLQITESTVKFHLGNAFEKLGVNSRQAAVERMKAILEPAPQYALP